MRTESLTADRLLAVRVCGDNVNAGRGRTHSRIGPAGDHLGAETVLVERTGRSVVTAPRHVRVVFSTDRLHASRVFRDAAPSGAACSRRSAPSRTPDEAGRRSGSRGRRAGAPLDGDGESGPAPGAGTPEEGWSCKVSVALTRRLISADRSARSDGDSPSATRSASVRSRRWRGSPVDTFHPLRPAAPRQRGATIGMRVTAPVARWQRASGR